MMASTHVYDMTTASAGKDKPRGEAGQGRIELALDPSELDLDSDAMAARYEQKLREEQSHLQKEDLSDMVAEHAAKQKVRQCNLLLPL
jgi:splicing factor 3B subunit 2